METLKTISTYPTIYTIEQGGIRVQTMKNRKLPAESHVPFENIRQDTVYHVERSSLLILSGGLFLFMLVINLISVPEDVPFDIVNIILLVTFSALALASFAAYFIHRQRFYFIKTYSGSFIRIGIRKNEQEVHAFVKALMAARRRYLKERYGKPSLFLSYDAQFSNFNHMYREGILTAAELEENIERLNNLFKQNAPVQRFPGYSDN